MSTFKQQEWARILDLTRPMQQVDPHAFAMNYIEQLHQDDRRRTDDILAGIAALVAA